MCSSKLLPIFSRNRSVEQTVHKGALWYYAHGLIKPCGQCSTGLVGERMLEGVHLHTTFIPLHIQNLPQDQAAIPAFPYPLGP